MAILHREWMKISSILPLYLPEVTAIAFTFCLSALLTCVAVAAQPAASQLNWGILPSLHPNSPTSVSASLDHVLATANASVDLSAHPIAAFHLEGTLNKDPLHQESDRAKADFPKILALAVCARLAQEPLRTKCLATTSSALFAWARTYRPTGNPVDEEFFAPLFEAVDLIAPILPGTDAKPLLNWVRAFAVAGDRYYAKNAPTGARAPQINNIRVNNWMAWRLCLRGMAAVITSDSASQKETRSMLAEFARQTFVSGENGKIDGATYDFVQRDALHYHVAVLQPLVLMMLFTPQLVDGDTRNLVGLGINFIKPYYLGEKQHIEFQHSVNSFDLERIQKDVNNPGLKIAPWNPHEADYLLVIARPVFPDIQSWTTNVAKSYHDDLTTFLVALHSKAPER